MLKDGFCQVPEPALDWQPKESGRRARRRWRQLTISPKTGCSVCCGLQERYLPVVRGQALRCVRALAWRTRGAARRCRCLLTRAASTSDRSRRWKARQAKSRGEAGPKLADHLCLTRAHGLLEQSGKLSTLEGESAGMPLGKTQCRCDAAASPPAQSCSRVLRVTPSDIVRTNLAQV